MAIVVTWDLAPGARSLVPGLDVDMVNMSFKVVVGCMVFAVKTCVAVAVVAVWIKRLVAQVLNRGDGGVWLA